MVEPRAAAARSRPRIQPAAQRSAARASCSRLKCPLTEIFHLSRNVLPVEFVRLLGVVRLERTKKKKEKKNEQKCAYSHLPSPALAPPTAPLFSSSPHLDASDVVRLARLEGGHERAHLVAEDGADGCRKRKEKNKNKSKCRASHCQRRDKIFTLRSLCTHVSPPASALQLTGRLLLLSLSHFYGGPAMIAHELRGRGLHHHDEVVEQRVCAWQGKRSN